MRIWSTDWWVNPGGTLERVHAALTELLEKDREQRANEVIELPDEPLAEPSGPDVTLSVDVINEAEAAIARAASGLRLPAVSAPLETEAQTEVVYARAASPLPVAENKTPDDQTDHRFQASQPTDAVSANTISADLFYEPSYDAVLQPMVEWVVQREGPVLDAVLARRIARVHGFQRTGSRIQERVEQIARRLFKTTEEAGGTFYWPLEVEPCSELAFRWPPYDDSTRGV